MNKTDMEIIVKAGVQEIPGWDEFSDNQKEELYKWYLKRFQFAEERNQKDIGNEFTKGFFGLLPISFIVGFYFAKWELNFVAIGNTIVAFILCVLVWYITSKLYESFVINKDGGVISKITFVVLSFIVSFMIGIGIAKL